MSSSKTAEARFFCSALVSECADHKMSEDRDEKCSERDGEHLPFPEEDAVAHREKQKDGHERHHNEGEDKENIFKHCLECTGSFWQKQV